MTTLLEPEAQAEAVDGNRLAAGLGGCEWGRGECDHRAELEILLPATNDRRQMCPGHVGFYMLAATTQHRASVVRVRQLISSTR